MAAPRVRILMVCMGSRRRTYERAEFVRFVYRINRP
jgi:hypothetical protein